MNKCTFLPRRCQFAVAVLTGPHGTGAARWHGEGVTRGARPWKPSVQSLLLAARPTRGLARHLLCTRRGIAVASPRTPRSRCHGCPAATPTPKYDRTHEKSIACRKLCTLGGIACSGGSVTHVVAAAFHPERRCRPVVQRARLLSVAAGCSEWMGGGRGLSQGVIYITIIVRRT